MSEHTNIEWCDSTFNPWIGCTKVSPACDHCYAERLDGRGIFGGAHWGPGVPRKRTSATNWRKPVQWEKTAHRFVQCYDCGWRGEQHGGPFHCHACGSLSLKAVRRRVFCASLADMLDNEVELEWFVDALDLMRFCTNLDFLFLTKRIGNLLRRLHESLAHVMDNPARKELSDWIARWLNGNPPDNVWLGATICNQQEADRDVPKLLAVPAAVRFLSIEPMLGPIDVTRWLRPRQTKNHDGYGGDHAPGWTTDTRTIDWIIAGGESGPQARPSHPEWFRSLRDQCKAAGVPFLFKQWGEWEIHSTENGHHDCDMARNNAVWLDIDGNTAKPSSAGLKNAYAMVKVGKKSAGRQLDGVTHNGFPEAHA